MTKIEEFTNVTQYLKSTKTYYCSITVYNQEHYKNTEWLKKEGKILKSLSHLIAEGKEDIIKERYTDGTSKILTSYINSEGKLIESDINEVDFHGTSLKII